LIESVVERWGGEMERRDSSVTRSERRIWERSASGKGE
jgi:hypothetical protein